MVTFDRLCGSWTSRRCLLDPFTPAGARSTTTIMSPRTMDIRMRGQPRVHGSDLRFLFGPFIPMFCPDATLHLLDASPPLDVFVIRLSVRASYEFVEKDHSVFHQPREVSSRRVASRCSRSNLITRVISAADLIRSTEPFPCESPSGKGSVTVRLLLLLPSSSCSAERARRHFEVPGLQNTHAFEIDKWATVCSS